jgi:serine protease Do
MQSSESSRLAKRSLPAIVIAPISIAIFVSLMVRALAVRSSDERPPSNKQEVAGSPRGFKSLTKPEELPALEEKIQAVYQRVSASTVALFAAKNNRHIGSGTIVSTEGHVLTHAHHEFEPGAPVKVVLGEGKKATGKLLGVHRPFDLSLVKLDGEGPWPAVPLGSPGDLKPGENCLALGFPVEYYRDGRRPLLRLGRVLSLSYLQVFTTCNTRAGDSGGSLFNLAGELVGVSGLIAGQLHGSGHVRVDIYLQIRNQLLEGKLVPQTGLLGPFEDTRGFAGLAEPVYRAVVVILSPDTPVSLGLIVAADGWIVTKGSELSDRVLCQLADGQRLEASVEARSWKYDLALLKVAAKNLPVATWSERPPKVGTIVASIGLDARPFSFGAVCSAIQEVPREQGQLAFTVQAAEPGVAGVRVKDIWEQKPRTKQLLHNGDLLTHVEDIPTPSPDEFWRMATSVLETPKAIVGERIQLTIQRAGKTLKVKVPIETESLINERFFPELVGRRTGFPEVFLHDAWVRPSQYGSPVADAQGKVIGINLATQSLGPVIKESAIMYAIPSDVVRKAIEELRQQRDTNGKR